MVATTGTSSRDLDSAATRDILRLFGELRAAGQTLVMVTHDERVAATADRVVSMRDGTLSGDTRLDGTGGGPGHGGSGGLGALLSWED